MTKSEKATMDRLTAALALAKALSWPSYREPPMVPPPSLEGVQAHVSGWSFNSHGVVSARHGAREAVQQAVEPMWSRSSSHGFGPQPVPGRSASQGPRALYGSRLDALRALRLDVTQHAAGVLAAIDAAIEEEEG